MKKGGFPKFMIKYIIQDMITLELIEKISSNDYKILKNPKEKRVRFLINSYY